MVGVFGHLKRGKAAMRDEISMEFSKEGIYIQEVINFGIGEYRFTFEISRAG